MQVGLRHPRQRLEPFEVPSCFLRASGQQPDLGQDRVGFDAVRELLQQVEAHFNCIDIPPITPQRLGEQRLQIDPFRLLSQQLLNLGNGLLVKLSPHVQPSKSPPGEHDTLWRESITPPVHRSYLFLNGGIIRIGLEGALHVPQRLFQIAIFLVDDRQTDMGDKIFRIGAEDAPEEIGRIGVSLLFE